MTIHQKFLLLASLGGLFFAATVAPVHAGAEGSVLTWQTPTTISGDTDVNTLGSLVAAFNMAGSAVTVNGVNFDQFSVPAQGTTVANGNFTFNESPGFFVPQTNLGSVSAPFANLSADYKTLLSSAISTSDNNALTLTISGLTLGRTYEFQWWLNASTFPNPGFRTTASAPNAVTLDDNTTDANGGVGQTVIGTFFAGSQSETITFAGIDINNAPTINAFQLRVIPEPATSALFLLGGVAVSAGVRRRRR